MEMTPKARQCVDVVRIHEGGLSMNPKDPGNWTGGKVGVGELRGTKGGIAASAHPDLDIKNLTDEQIDAIYAEHYWPMVRGEDLPLPLAMAVLDAAVMSGTGDRLHHRAVYWLQQSLGVLADGVLGAATIRAAQSCNLRQVIVQFCAERLDFLKQLETWGEFGNGWDARVVDTERRALALA